MTVAFWITFCLLFSLKISAMASVPLMRHPTLPRHKKAVLVCMIFLVLAGGGLLLYSWIGLPPMAVL